MQISICIGDYFNNFNKATTSQFLRQSNLYEFQNFFLSLNIFKWFYINVVCWILYIGFVRSFNFERTFPPLFSQNNFSRKKFEVHFKENDFSRILVKEPLENSRTRWISNAVSFFPFLFCIMYSLFILFYFYRIMHPNSTLHSMI